MGDVSLLDGLDSGGVVVVVVFFFLDVPEFCFGGALRFSVNS